MNKPYGIIFFGLLAVVMGIGEDKTEFIPSEIKLTIGFLLIGYGIYLLYKPKEKATELNNKTNNRKIKPSYIYLAIAVLTLKFTQYLIRENEYILSIWIIIIGIIGLGLTVYGINMFFKERRQKKESGSIE